LEYENWEDPKLNKKLVVIATNQCAKIKGGYIIATFMKLPNFSHLPLQNQN